MLAFKKSRRVVKHGASKVQWVTVPFSRENPLYEPTCVVPMKGTAVRVFTSENYPENFKNDVAETLERLKRNSEQLSADSRDY
jgi:hypothetical protein